MRGRFEEAGKLAQRALDIFPHCANALTIQGLLKMEVGNDPEAVRLFQEAIDADPALGAAYLALGHIYNSQGRFKDALVPLDRANAFLPDIWSVYYETATARLGLGERQSALIEIAHAERFAEGDPHGVSALSLLRGAAQFQQKDYSGAKEYLNQAVERDPKGPFAILAQSMLERVRPLLGSDK